MDIRKTMSLSRAAIMLIENSTLEGARNTRGEVFVKKGMLEGATIPTSAESVTITVPRAALERFNAEYKKRKMKRV